METVSAKSRKTKLLFSHSTVACVYAFFAFDLYGFGINLGHNTIANLLKIFRMRTKEARKMKAQGSILRTWNWVLKYSVIWVYLSVDTFQIFSCLPANESYLCCLGYAPQSYTKRLQLHSYFIYYKYYIWFQSFPTS